MIIRPFQQGEEAALRNVFFASVHGLATQHYTSEQVQAWAPQAYDEARWNERLRNNRPFVALIDGVPAGFADVQPSGYIDQFFVSPHCARQGVATALMLHLIATARAAGVTSLLSRVSLTAQALFRKHGFVVETINQVAIGEVVLENATMRLDLAAGSAPAA